jgi:hypothetical protein
MESVNYLPIFLKSNIKTKPPLPVAVPDHRVGVPGGPGHTVWVKGNGKVVEKVQLGLTARLQAHLKDRPQVAQHGPVDHPRGRTQVVEGVHHGQGLFPKIKG